MPSYQIPGDTQVPLAGNPAGDMNSVADMLGLIASLLTQLLGGGTNTDPAGNATNVAAVVAGRLAASLAPGTAGRPLTSNGASSAPTFQAIAASALPTGTTSTQGALQLDGTATDIQALGTQAAGSTGKAADAGHVHPATGVWTKLATTGNSGYTLVNGTGNIFTWTAPNDGNIHRVMLIATLNVTTAETGGQLQLAATNPAAAAANQSFFSAQALGSHENWLTVNVAANTTVTLSQNTALTAGAAVLYAELWGS